MKYRIVATDVHTGSITYSRKATNRNELEWLDPAHQRWTLEQAETFERDEAIGLIAITDYILAELTGINWIENVRMEEVE